MLKPLFATMALVGATAASFGQGLVNFDTQSVGARILKADGTPPSVGTAYFARLYSAAGQNAPKSALAPAGNNPVNLRSGANGGYVQVSGITSKGITVDPVVSVTTVNGGPATVQLRAWSSAFDTYEAAAAASSEFGESPLLNLAATGNPAAAPPTTPVDLIGLQGFTMVPEPSTVALGVLGAAALLFARRRR
jgi:hypothetical protein